MDTVYNIDWTLGQRNLKHSHIILFLQTAQKNSDALQQEIIKFSLKKNQHWQHAREMYEITTPSPLLLCIASQLELKS
jgi:hypothetical protein